MLRLEQISLQSEYNNMTKVRLKQNFDFATFVDKQSLPILKNKFPVQKKTEFDFGFFRFFIFSKITFPKFLTLEKFIGRQN